MKSSDLCISYLYINEKKFSRSILRNYKAAAPVISRTNPTSETVCANQEINTAKYSIMLVINKGGT